MSTAPELSPAEAARVAAFDAAPTPPECDPERVETVARWLRNRFPLSLPEAEQEAADLLALVAALPPQEPFDLEAACQPVARRSGTTRTFRAALASPAPAPQDANGCPDQPHHGVDCPGDACRYVEDPR